MKLRFPLLLSLICWALLATVICAAKGWPLRSIASAVTVALATLRASRMWDELKDESPYPREDFNPPLRP